MNVVDTTLGNWVKADWAARGRPDRAVLLPLTAEGRSLRPPNYESPTQASGFSAGTRADVIERLMRAGFVDGR